MIELTSVVISKRFRCHILWIWRNLTEFYEIVIFVNSVPGYKFDGQMTVTDDVVGGEITAHRLLLRRLLASVTSHEYLAT
jgi:hypothetical protein